MAIEKESRAVLRFTEAGCSVTITDQVVFEVTVPGGVQTINFPVHELPDVYALLSTVAGDGDVADLIVAHTPEPEPEPEPVESDEGDDE